jgi:hypothetical protein
LPSKEEWDALITAVGGESTAGTKLKARSGWNDNGGGYIPDTDDYGFSALPGGRAASGNNFYYVGGTDYAHHLMMHAATAKADMSVEPETSSFSVRCVQDERNAPTTVRTLPKPYSQGLAGQTKGKSIGETYGKRTGNKLFPKQNLEQRNKPNRSPILCRIIFSLEKTGKFIEVHRKNQTGTSKL